VHQIRFRPGLRPGPRWGSLQRSPRPPSWIKGALLLRRRGGEGTGGEGTGGKGEGAGGEGEGTGRGREGKEEEGRERREGKGRRRDRPPPFGNSWIRPWYEYNYLVRKVTKLQV